MAKLLKCYDKIFPSNYGDLQYIYRKMPSLSARYFSVCRLRAHVVQRHIHYRRRFSVRANIVIHDVQRLLTLEDHCVKI